MSIPEAVLDIYERAVDTWDEDTRDETLDPFVRELDAMDFNLSFGEAAALDEEYFGVWGNYWAKAFGTPQVGDEVNTTYDDGVILTFQVTGRGLLTLKMEVISVED